MATIIQDNIQFTDVLQPSFVTSGRIARGPYTIDDQNNITDTYGPLINAIDIDWNDAQLDNDIISTTGELLTRLNNTYTKSEIDELLENSGNNSGDNDNPDLSNYVTQSNFTDTIAELESSISTGLSEASNRLDNIYVKDDVYTKDEIDDLLSNSSSNTGDSDIELLQLQIDTLKQNFDTLLSMLNNQQITNEYYLWYANASNELPSVIDATNATLIEDTESIYINTQLQPSVNPNDEDIFWYIALPNVNTYQIWDDHDSQELTEQFEIINNNFLDKYILYKSKVAEAALNLHAIKI